MLAGLPRHAPLNEHASCRVLLLVVVLVVVVVVVLRGREVSVRVQRGPGCTCTQREARSLGVRHTPTDMRAPSTGATTQTTHASTRHQRTPLAGRSPCRVPGS
jgi:hypothetical protein